MISYRITKFDPSKRDNEGKYLDNSAWTSISDIGKEKYKSSSFEDYEKVENSYIEAIRLILIEQKIDTIKVDSFENHLDEKRDKKFLKNINIDYREYLDQLENGFEIGFWEVDELVKLILRGIIWMNLINERINIIFGYDYYMYIECEELKFGTILQIERMGLYVEPHIKQREFIITDEKGNPI